MAPDHRVLVQLKRPLGYEDVDAHPRNGRLVQLLPSYFTPDADIYAVYPQRHQLAARVRAFVDFVSGSLQQASIGAGR
jgi:DNA-binding transcriptional LysR family regulator